MAAETNAEISAMSDGRVISDDRVISDGRVISEGCIVGMTRQQLRAAKVGEQVYHLRCLR